jgi:hypothetical protein
MTQTTIAALSAALLAATPAAAPAQSGWTWTLYEADGMVTLAHEVPGTARLRATLECTPGQNRLVLTVYGVRPAAAFATLTAGEASATTELEAVRGEALRAAAPLDHPVVTAMAVDGQMTLDSGGRSEVILVPRAHLAKLRRLVELCAG